MNKDLLCEVTTNLLLRNHGRRNKRICLKFQRKVVSAQLFPYIDLQFGSLSLSTPTHDENRASVKYGRRSRTCNAFCLDCHAPLFRRPTVKNESNYLIEDTDQNLEHGDSRMTGYSLFNQNTGLVTDRQLSLTAV